MNDDRQVENPAIDSGEPPLTDLEARMALDVLRSEQNLVNGAAAGLVVCVVAAGIWATVTILTGYQVGWIAIGIGFVVGYAIQLTGKGIDQAFGITGGVFALVGCALGNVFTISYFVAGSEGIPFMEILTQLDLEIVADMLVSTFEIMDVLFYGFAAYFGYKYAFRQVTSKDIARALGKSL
jgi:hypothetical protein